MAGSTQGSHFPGASEFITMCSTCKRVQDVRLLVMVRHAQAGIMPELVMAKAGILVEKQSSLFVISRWDAA